MLSSSPPQFGVQNEQCSSEDYVKEHQNQFQTQRRSRRWNSKTRRIQKLPKESTKNRLNDRSDLRWKGDYRGRRGRGSGLAIGRGAIRRTLGRRWRSRRRWSSETHRIGPNWPELPTRGKAHESRGAAAGLTERERGSPVMHLIASTRYLKQWLPVWVGIGNTLMLRVLQWIAGNAHDHDQRSTLCHFIT